MNDKIEKTLEQIERLADECQDSIDALQHILLQARKSSLALRGACEYVEEFHELRTLEERDRESRDGD